MSIFKFVLDFTLLPEAAAVVQIALEHITGLELEQVKRNGLGLLDGDRALPSSSLPACAGKGRGQGTGGEAKEMFHGSVLLVNRGQKARWSPPPAASSSDHAAAPRSLFASAPNSGQHRSRCRLLRTRGLLAAVTARRSAASLHFPGKLPLAGA